MNTICRVHAQLACNVGINHMNKCTAMNVPRHDHVTCEYREVEVEAQNERIKRCTLCFPQEVLHAVSQ